jgi:hypothetical protein
MDFTRANMGKLLTDQWQYREARTRKDETSLTSISDKQRAILSALVYGLEGAAAEKHSLAPGKALTPIEAAAYFHVRRAYVRDLLEQPLFKAELAAQIANKRLGYMPEALDRIGQAMRNEDDSVGLRAAVAMIGERAGAANAAISVTVNNQTNVAAQIRPGYVVRLPADLAPDAEPETP